jgi:hypothetical protein
VTVSYAIEIDEHVAFNEWVIKITQIKQKRLPIFISYLLFFIFMLLIVALFKNPAIPTGIIGASLLLLIYFFRSKTFRRQRLAKIKYILESDKTIALYSGLRTTTIMDRGLHVSSKAGERLIPWGNMNYDLTETLDIFYQTPHDSIVIPRTAFKSDAHREAFLAEIEQRRTGTPATQPKAESGTWWTQGSSVTNETLAVKNK